MNGGHGKGDAMPRMAAGRATEARGGRKRGSGQPQRVRGTEFFARLRFVAALMTAPLGAVSANAAAATKAGGAVESPAEHVEFFEAKVRPILVESCYKCHSTEAGKSKGGLLLDTREALRKGGGGGTAIVPGDPEKSLLIEAIRYQSEDLQMPPAEEGGKLSADKIAVLEEWVRIGAPDPRVGGKPHPMDIEAARKHWAFQPVRKPAVPTVKAKQRVVTPVDAFVLAKLEEKQLSLAPAADPRTLLRRITSRWATTNLHWRGWGF